MPSIPQNELNGYAADDWNAIDYQMWRPYEDGPVLRGPELTDLRPGCYIVAIGAAQTFGRFCAQPYPALLSAGLGLPVLNLGCEGAGPKLFSRPRLLQLINNAALAIVQAMSGRSLSNFVFECPNDGGTLRRWDRPNTKPVLALNAWREWMIETEATYGADQAGRVRAIKALVQDSRTRWVGEMALLARQITVPKVLFWFAKRTPDYAEQYSNAEHVLGDFPQLIDASTFEAIQPLFDKICVAVSSRGCPQPVFDRFTGAPHSISSDYKHPTENSYYPSPQMHEDAACVLTPVISDLMARQQSGEAGLGRKLAQAVKCYDLASIA